LSLRAQREKKLKKGVMMAKKKCKYNWHMAFRCLFGTAFYLLGIAAFVKYIFY